MAIDYPDWTSMVQITGSDVDLDFNLVASEITVDVNLTASEVTLDVNLKAQDVTIDIDIDAQSVGIYLRPDWGVLQGEDKIFQVTPTNRAYGVSLSVGYTVPTGKTFYIVAMTSGMYAFDAANYDHHHWLHTYLYLSGAAVAIGGNVRAGGGQVTFEQPIRVNAGDTATMIAYNRSNFNCFVTICFWGYEI